LERLDDALKFNQRMWSIFHRGVGCRVLQIIGLQKRWGMIQ